MSVAADFLIAGCQGEIVEARGRHDDLIGRVAMETPGNSVLAAAIAGERGIRHDAEEKRKAAVVVKAARRSLESTDERLRACSNPRHSSETTLDSRRSLRKYRSHESRPERLCYRKLSTPARSSADPP